MKFGIKISLAIALLAASTLFLLTVKDASSFEKISELKDPVKIYKSSNCGCCQAYASYFKRNGNPNIEVISTSDMESVKSRFKIPESVESCHTARVGGYFVEGHVPLEAVEKLLKEKPKVSGISLPGMPSGSPGMPGKKEGDFIIYKVEGKKVSEFARL